MEEFGHIVNLMEQRNPTVIMRVVLTDLFWRVIVVQLVWPKIVLGLLIFHLC